MKTVLFVFFTYATTGGGVTSQEFENAELCEQAKAVLQQEAKEFGPMKHRFRAVCLPAEEVVDG